jgi:integrase/recombinase XerD
MGCGSRVGMASGVLVDGGVEEAWAGFRAYLLSERGVRETTAAGYEADARLFLSAAMGPKGVGFERLTAAEVSGFLVRECQTRRVTAAVRLVTVARSVLRYLHLAGVIAASLEWAVPAVAPVRGRALARGVSPETVVALLASCDRRRLVGRRDYAIVLVLVRLGLRVSEVAGLGLDDLDWRAGGMLVHGKGGRRDRLPLPVDVGEALVDYLRYRPPSEHRAVFLPMIEGAPPITRHMVGGLLREASARAGVPRVAPHQLRHTAASVMLGAGASLGEIAQVMRHSQQRTTEVERPRSRGHLIARVCPVRREGCGVHAEDASAVRRRVPPRGGWVTSARGAHELAWI